MLISQTYFVSMAATSRAKGGIAAQGGVLWPPFRPNQSHAAYGIGLRVTHHPGTGAAE
jgi:hypothetical protein